MKMNNCMIKKILFLVFLSCSMGAFSQKIAIKNNLMYDALKTPNLSFEFSVGWKWTFDTQVGMNFFFYQKMSLLLGIRQKNSVIGWYNQNYATGLVTCSTGGFLACTFTGAK